MRPNPKRPVDLCRRNSLVPSFKAPSVKIENEKKSTDGSKSTGQILRDLDLEREVAAVFAAAAPKRGKVALPRPADVCGLALWLSELRRGWHRKRPKELIADIVEARERRHEVARAIEVLQRELPAMIAPWQRSTFDSERPAASDPMQPFHVWLGRLLAAATAVSPLIGAAPGRGRRPERELALLVELERLVEPRWQVAGLTKLTFKSDGPKVAAIAGLFRLVTGAETDEDRVSSALKRYHERRRTKVQAVS
jgi:hypothetical protein